MLIDQIQFYYSLGELVHSYNPIKVANQDIFYLFLGYYIVHDLLISS